MYKALTLTALAGVAVAKPWEYHVFDAVLKNEETGYRYYELSLDVAFDTGYKTQYNPPNMIQEMPQYAQSSQGYALNIFSNMRVIFNHQAFESYKATYDFFMKLLDFTPYGQVVATTRFDHGQKFNYVLYGYRYLDVANWQTRVKENAKTCHWSVFDASETFVPACDYDEDKQTDYWDAVWQYDTGKKLNAKMLADGSNSLNEIIGEHKYYMQYSTN